LGQLLQLHAAACWNNAVSVERRIECISGRFIVGTAAEEMKRAETAESVWLAGVQFRVQPVEPGWAGSVEPAGSGRVGPGRVGLYRRVGPGRLVLCKGQTL